MKKSIDSILADMSLEEKVGQLVMVGFAGQEVNPEVTAMIEECHLGGIILFARNIKEPQQTARLTAGLQEAAVRSKPGIPLFISTDQEGGTVVRLSEGASVSPGNMALGATRSADLAYEAAAVTARELLACGVNVNLAPSVDVNNNPFNPVIGLRSFGEDPDLVAELGVAAVRGYQDNGVIAVAKHFPGHGDTDVDSHLALPVVAHDEERLFAVELKPFQEAIAAGVEAIMTAHVVFPAFEPDSSIPATLSFGVLTRLLRERLKFTGLIMTDCMEMKAIADNFGTAEAAVRTIEAGGDMVLVSHTPSVQRASYEGLLAAVQSGRISEQRIEASVRRVLQAKQKYGLLEDVTVEPEAVPTRVGIRENREVMNELARKAITLVKNDGILPLKPDQNIFVVDERARALTVAEDRARSVGTVGQQLQQVYPNVSALLVDLKPGEDEIARAVEKASAADVIVVATQDAHRWQGQPELVRALQKTGKPVAVIGLRTPYDLQCFPDVNAYVACFGYLPALIQAAVDVITGRLSPMGKLPVSIPEVCSIGHSVKLGD